MIRLLWGENMKSINVEKLVLEYMGNNVLEEVKEDFIKAVVHFIINENNCSKYDAMRIKYRFNKIEDNEVLDYIKLCSTYGYVIYRSVIFNLVEENEKSKCCEAIINISNIITKYVTMEIDEEDLHSEMEAAISNLYISDNCNKIVLDKFKDCKFIF